MRKLLLSLLLISGYGIAFSQKTINAPNAEARNLTGFHGISVSTGIELWLTQSTTEAVAVSAANKDDVDKIITVVEDGILKIHYDFNIWRLLKYKGDKKLKAYVSIINIDKLNLSAGAQVRIDGALKSKDLDLRAASGAQFNGAVEAGTIDVDQASGSQVNISGSVKDLYCRANSGSQFHGYDLAVSNNCEAHTSSGAQINVTINGEMSVYASSGGQVFYKGTGTIRHVKSNSGGNVSKRG